MNEHTIANYIEQVTESGCWIWKGAVKKDGYGYVRWEGKVRLAHRVLYEYMRSTIPVDLTLDHLCRVRCCVNPSHLEIVTLRENILRGNGIAANNAKKTVCHNGHRLDELNTIVWTGKRGENRKCRTCANRNSRLRRSRKRIGNMEGVNS